MSGVEGSAIVEAFAQAFANMKEDLSRCVMCDERVQVNTDDEWIHARYPATDGHQAFPNVEALEEHAQWVIDNP